MKRIELRYWPVLVIIGIVGIFSWPYIFRGRVPFPSTYLVQFFAPWSATYGMPVKNNAMPDVITQIYPWKRLTVHSWKQGQLPLWNPYSFSGTSHVGSYQPAVFSPVTMLFMILPEIHAWSIMILMQPLLAGIFMYIYLRSLKLSREGSLIGAVSYMFCGFLVVWMAYGTLAYSVLWLPGILFGLNRYIGKGDTRYLALAAILLGLSFLSGHFQMSVYVALFVLGYLVFRWTEPETRSRVYMGALGLVIGVALAAPQILPALESYANSVRSILFTKGEVIPWQYVVTLFSPDFYGNPVTRNDWFGHYAEWSSYVGVVPLLFVILAVYRGFAASPWIRFFSVMAVISLLMAFESPLVELMYMLRIPVLSTSAASRVIVLFSFSLAVLSGYGMDLWKKYMADRSWNSVKGWLVGSGAAVFLLWVALVIVRPLPPDKLVIAMRNSMLPTVFYGAALLLCAGSFLTPKKLYGFVPAVLILITVIEMLRFAYKWMPFDPAEYAYPEVPVIQKTRELVRDTASRVFGNIGGEVGVTFGIPLVEGYDAVYQNRYGMLISSVTDGTIGKTDRSVVTFNKRGKYSERMLQLLGVRYYLHKKSDGRNVWAYPFWEMKQYRKVWEDNDFEIWENAYALPRAFLAASYEVKTRDQEIIDRILDPSFPIDSSVVLEQKPAVEPASGSGSARIVSYTPNEVRIETDAEAAKLLVLTDVYDKGWHAYVDGNKTGILRADYDFRAVPVPPGSHTIVMTYLPETVRYGLMLSGFATLGILWLVTKRST